jgi:xanthine dehydrogenase large subunit
MQPLVQRLVDRPAATPAARRGGALQHSSPVLKKGLALTPVKFGISFNVNHLNQAGALVHIYTDGSVLVNHGGTEMGQGLNTKVARWWRTSSGIASSTRARAPPPTRTRLPTPRPPPRPPAAISTARRRRTRRARSARGWPTAPHAAMAARRGAVRFDNDEVHVNGRVLAFATAVVPGLHRPRTALERRFLRHARPVLGPRDAAPATPSTISPTARRSAKSSSTR